MDFALGFCFAMPASLVPPMSACGHVSRRRIYTPTKQIRFKLSDQPVKCGSTREIGAQASISAAMKLQRARKSPALRFRAARRWRASDRRRAGACCTRSHSAASLQDIGRRADRRRTAACDSGAQGSCASAVPRETSIPPASTTIRHASASRTFHSVRCAGSAEWRLFQLRIFAPAHPGGRGKSSAQPPCGHQPP